MTVSQKYTVADNNPSLNLYPLIFKGQHDGPCIGGSIIEAPGLFDAIELGRKLKPTCSVAYPLEVDDPILRNVPEELRNRFLSKEDLDKWLPPPITKCRIPVEFVTGAAGTGKSHECRQRKNRDPKSIVLSATTGVAAINMGDGTRTINSLLGFFDLTNLQQQFDRGNLHQRIRQLAEDEIKEVIIDEVSMLSGQKLDLIFQAFNEVGAIKLTLTGDFAQLQPIEERDPNGRQLPLKYAFDADCWPHFAKTTNRLTKMWRQDNPVFLEALNALRRGNGAEALSHLQALGVEFRPRIDENFAGTTLRAENESVDRYNRFRLLQLEGGDRVIQAGSTRWALDGQPGEWKHVPEWFPFKIGAFVMVLANDTPEFRYVNGDCGTVVDLGDGCIRVKLDRTGDVVDIRKILRTKTCRDLPRYAMSGTTSTVPDMRAFESALPPQHPVFAEKDNCWVVGWLHYFPLRLGWASTVHKSQGLTLNRLQIDLNSSFIGSPSMCYVAMSRCRTPEGLTLVGNPEQVVAKCSVDPRVKEWL
jgi:hypothetical protein